MPKVTLISYTRDAVELLIYTKNTRLNMSPKGLNEIRCWPADKKMAELEYMSKTLPSSWEFADLVFCIEGVSRAFTHQLVRTRTASYAQQAMRVVDMTDFEYHIGPSIKDKFQRGQYENTMHYINGAYRMLIGMGVKPEDARGILPTDILTNIVMKMNLRTLSELVLKRKSARVQGEYAEVLAQMITETEKVWPWAKMFIEPKALPAYDRVTTYLRKMIDKEIAETGKPQHETETWAIMKDMDLIRTGQE